MIATVQKWGNSLGVRIPKTIAVDSDMRAGSAVEMTVEDGRVILEPKRTRKYRLGTMLKSVSSKNMHSEVDTGLPTGKEVW
jgi:antitoxin MazE